MACEFNTGIYKIVNTITGDFYIGSASRVNKIKSHSGFYVRFKRHKADLIKGVHHSIILQRAWNKYGEENFEFKILVLCPPEYCIKLEQWFLDNLRPKYNIRTVADSNKGVVMREEIKQKISKAHKGRKVTWGYKIGNSNRKENNPERAKILSKALTGRVLSEESRIANRDKRRLHKSIAKLSVDDVKIIKTKLKNLIHYKEIASEYKVSISCIMDIKHNRTFKDIII